MAAYSLNRNEDSAERTTCSNLPGVPVIDGIEDTMTPHVDEEEFAALYRRCSNWGRWGKGDMRGALNLVDSSSVAGAAAEIREGITVSLGRDLDDAPGPDNPQPLMHHMLSIPSVDEGSALSAASDFVGVACHGEAHTHLDALCHIAYEGQLHNGWSAGQVTVSGAEACGLSVTSAGIVTRAVLLDFATRTGGRWLPGGYAISLDELSEVAAATGAELHPGDLLLLRTGHTLRRKVDGPWDSANDKAGLHPSVMPWLKDRDIAAAGFDGDGDPAPIDCAGISAPVHVLGINAIGLHFFDSLDLDDLAHECAQRQRWSVCFVALPLRIPRATGCPVNPIAIL